MPYSASIYLRIFNGIKHPSTMTKTWTMRVRVFFISILLTRRRAYFQIRMTFRTRPVRTESRWRLWNTTSADSRGFAEQLGEARGAGEERTHGRAAKIRNGTAG